MGPDQEVQSHLVLCGQRQPRMEAVAEVGVQVRTVTDRVLCLLYYNKSSKCIEQAVMEVSNTLYGSDGSFKYVVWLFV